MYGSVWIALYALTAHTAAHNNMGVISQCRNNSIRMILQNIVKVIITQWYCPRRLFSGPAFDPVNEFSLTSRSLNT